MTLNIVQLSSPDTLPCQLRGVVAEIGGSAHEVGFLFFTKGEGTLDRWSFGALVVTNEKSNELSF
jgi:hypothetical protein